MFLLHGNGCSLAARRQTRVFAPTLRFRAPGTSFTSAHALNRFLVLVRLGFTFSRVKNRPFPCLNLLLPFPLFHSGWTLFRVWHHLHFLPRLGQVSRPLHLRDLFQHKALVSPLSGQFWWREISLTQDSLLWSVLPAVVFKLVTSDHEINIIALALCDYLNFFIPETPIHEPISIFYPLPRLWNTARWATSGSTSRSYHRSYELWRSLNKPWGWVVWTFSSSSWIPNTDRERLGVTHSWAR